MLKCVAHDLRRIPSTHPSRLSSTHKDTSNSSSTQNDTDSDGDKSEYDLGYMINELIEAANKHLQRESRMLHAAAETEYLYVAYILTLDIDGSPPANWSDFWDDVYILMHAMIGKLRQAGYSSD